MNYPLQSQKPLASFCQTHSFLKFKISLATFYNYRYSDYAEKLITLTEFFQVISLALFLNFPKENYDDEKFVFRIVVYFFKLINPSYLLDFKKSNRWVNIALAFVLFSSILRYCLTLYIILTEYWNKKKNRMLYEIWRWVFRLQARVLGVFITSFAVQVIMHISKGYYHPELLTDFGSIFVWAIFIVVEYIFSLMIETQFCQVLPTKNFLSAKNNHTQVLVLLQKLLLQILQLTFLSNNYSNQWIFSILSMIFSIGNNYYFYTRLPFYKFKTLLFEGKLLALVFSFDISCFFYACLKQGEYKEANISFTITLWAILSLLSMKFSHEFITRIYLNILLDKKTQGIPEIQIQRIILAEEIEEHLKLPTMKSGNYDISFLLREIKEANKNEIFKDNSRFSDSRSSESLGFENTDQAYIYYLEDLLLKSPQNAFIKLHLAYQYSKNLKLYTKAIQIVSELGINKQSLVYINSLFLLYKIENAIMNRHNSENSNLNLLTYIKCQLFIDEFKQDIIEQINLKVKICENIIGEVSDLGEIYKCGQSVWKSRAKIQKKIESVLSIIPNNYTKPLVLCAEYHLILNYCLDTYEKLQIQFNRKQLKNEKYFREINLNEDNLYQDENAFVMLSGEKHDHGKIVFCTKAIEEICGGEKNMYYGTHISSIFTSSMQNYYKELFKKLLENETQYNINQNLQKKPIFLYNRDKYVIEAQIHLQIHPYITQNFYYDMIIRPIPSGKEYILVKENGDIESATKNISIILGLNTSFSQSVNIKSLSDELYKVNEAFNIVNRNKVIKHKKSQSFPEDSLSSKESTEIVTFANINEIMELHNAYSLEGKNIILRPYFQDSSNRRFTRKNFYYNCKILAIQLDSIFMKLITLEKVDKGVIEEHNDKTKEKRTTLTFPSIVVERQVETQQEENSVMVTGSENFFSPERDNNEITPYLDTDDYLLTSTRNLLSPRKTKIETKNFPTINIYSQVTQNTEFPKDSGRVFSLSSIPTRENKYFRFQTIDEFKKEKSKEEATGNGNQEDTSKYSRYKRQEKAFQRGIASKYYPRAFNFWASLFYSVVFITFVSQIILFEVSRVTMKNLVMKKNLLKFSQIRFYQMLRLNVNSVGAYVTIDSVVNVTGNLREIPSVLDNMKSFLPGLLNANNMIIESLYKLDTDLIRQLYSSDVRIWGSPYDMTLKQFAYINQFQLMDRILTAINSIFVNHKTLFSDLGLHLFEFVALNTINDFVYKSFEMKNYFLDLVNREKDYFQDVIILCLLTTPFLLVGVGLMLIFIIWNQYKIEKNYMLAFIKLNSRKVKNIMKSLKSFERGLKNEENFSHSQSLNWFVDLTTLPKEEQGTNSHKRQQTQRIDYKQIRSRYKGFSIKVTAYIAILIGILVGNYLTANSSKETIYRRQSQLNFANELSSFVALSYTTFTILFVWNNTCSVNKMKPLDAGIEILSDIRTLQGKMPQVFQEKDGSYDPIVEALLISKNSCADLTNNSLFYCNVLKNEFGQQTFLLPSMAAFEKLAQKKIKDYQDCNKTTMESILNTSFIDQKLYLANFVTIGGQAQLISERVDHNLTESIDDAELQRTAFFITFSICMFCVSLLVWFQILSKLREIDNDFKKVLQVFPSTLILSSFFLKSFLKKSSQEIINI